MFLNADFEVITEDNPVPDHDYHVHLLSLPSRFYSLNKKIVPQENFLPRNSVLNKRWQKRLSAIKEKKVGIYWQGNVAHNNDHFRSIPLSMFGQLMSVENVKFVSLQKGVGAEQIVNFKFKKQLVDFASKENIEKEENIFEDTIAILRQMDLVITVDTAIAHLASTLEIETWILLPLRPDWRWFLNSDQTPWYKNTSLYRQKKIHTWGPVFNKVKEDLVIKFES